MCAPYIQYTRQVIRVLLHIKITAMHQFFKVKRSVVIIIQQKFPFTLNGILMLATKVKVSYK